MAPRPAPPPRRPRPSALPGLQPGGLRHEPHGPPPPGPPALSGKERPPGGSGGAAPRPGAEGRGLPTLSSLQKKKKRRPRSCNGHELPTTKFPKCLTNGRPGRGTRARLPRPGAAGHTPHARAPRVLTQLRAGRVLISGLTFRCSLVEIKGPSHLAFKSGQAITPSQSCSGCVGPRWAPLLLP